MLLAFEGEFNGWKEDSLVLHYFYFLSPHSAPNRLTVTRAGEGIYLEYLRSEFNLAK
jgi:hypothetical protein